MTTLRQAWDDAAADWIRWARSPGHDHAFWRMNLPTTLALVPEPGALTVDVGCGEGRLARELAARGHRVVGIEGSPALAAAAREADPTFEVHVADAAAMPLPDGAADLAVASLSLMNMDDVPGVAREIARVLRPGGALVCSILHPVNSWHDTRGAGYFETVRYVERIERDGLRMTFTDTHRPFEDYVAALAGAGLAIEALREPRPDAAYLADHPDVEHWTREPGFLHLRARRGSA